MSCFLDSHRLEKGSKETRSKRSDEIRRTYLRSRRSALVHISPVLIFQDFDHNNCSLKTSFHYAHSRVNSKVQWHQRNDIIISYDMGANVCYSVKKQLSLSLRARGSGWCLAHLMQDIDGGQKGTRSRVAGSANSASYCSVFLVSCMSKTFFTQCVKPRPHSQRTYAPRA